MIRQQIMYKLFCGSRELQSYSQKSSALKDWATYLKYFQYDRHKLCYFK